MADELSWMTPVPLVVVGYLLLLITDLLYSILPELGSYQVIVGLSLSMVTLSLAYVYFRRFSNWVGDSLDTLWQELTILDGKNASSSLTTDTKDQIGSPNPKWISASDSISYRIWQGGVWIWKMWLLHFVLILGVVLAQYFGLFSGLVSQYSANEWVIPSALAIISPIMALFILGLSNLANGPASALVIILVVGFPALAASPGMMNVVSALEQFIYDYAVLPAESKLVGSQDIEREEAQVRITIIATICLIVFHTWYFVL